MSSPLISVIVPVYNVEQFLPYCIDSIIVQTFTDYELLLVDDGSRDNSGKICDEYAKKDNRIRVFHKVNGGVSSARNLGLNNANGEWVCFIDSDDTVSNNYIQHMAEAISDKDVLILTNYKKDTMGVCPVKLDNITLHNDEIIRYFIDNNIFALTAPYSKLYKIEIIKKYSLNFPEGINMGEDVIFIMRYLNKISYASIINVCDYNVRETKGSLSSKYYPFENEWNCYLIWKKEMMTFLTRFGKIYDNALKVAWENRIGTTFNRCLQCLYRQKEPLSFSTKLKYLKSIPYSDIKEFAIYYKPNKLRRRILKFLIVNHLYRLYIIAGSFDKFNKGII